MESLDPTKDEESRAKFPENVDWKDSTYATDELAMIEEQLVEFHDIFARHQFDIGMNEEFKMKLTPKDGSPAYSQTRLAPINFKEDILVELAMLHNNAPTTNGGWTVHKPIIAYRWLTNVQLKCWPLPWLVAHSHTEV